MTANIAKLSYSIEIPMETRILCVFLLHTHDVNISFSFNPFSLQLLHSMYKHTQKM